MSQTVSFLDFSNVSHSCNLGFGLSVEVSAICLAPLLNNGILEKSLVWHTTVAQSQSFSQ